MLCGALGKWYRGVGIMEHSGVEEIGADGSGMIWTSQRLMMGDKPWRYYIMETVNNGKR